MQNQKSNQACLSGQNAAGSAQVQLDPLTQWGIIVKGPHDRRVIVLTTRGGQPFVLDTDLLGTPLVSFDLDGSEGPIVVVRWCDDAPGESMHTLSFPNISKFRKYCEDEVSQEKKDRAEFGRIVEEDALVHRPVTERELFG